MKLKIGKALKSVARFAKNNPEVALMAVGVVAPGLAKKAAPVVVGMVKKRPDPSH